jgi:hypothetical protein
MYPINHLTVRIGLQVYHMCGYYYPHKILIYIYITGSQLCDLMASTGGHMTDNVR